jgi:Transposase DDE domain group 1
MIDATPLPFDLPSVERKKLTVDFDGGTQSSNSGLLLRRQAQRKLGVCRRLVEAMPDRRHPDRIPHAMFEMVTALVAAIACGHKDAIDLDSFDEGRGRPLSADRGAAGVQSTISHLENAPSKTKAARRAVPWGVGSTTIDVVLGKYMVETTTHKPVDLSVLAASTLRSRQTLSER